MNIWFKTKQKRRKTVKVKVIVEVDKKKLKEVFAEVIGENPSEVSFSDAFQSEFEWLEQSGIYLLDWEVEKEN